MQPCAALPLLSPDLTTLELEGALKELLRNKIQSDELYWACALRHNDMVRWINEE